MPSEPKSPLDIECPTCGSPLGEQCTNKPHVAAQWVRVLDHSHDSRWRAFNKTRNEFIKLQEWEAIYGSQRD